MIVMLLFHCCNEEVQSKMASSKLERFVVTCEHKCKCVDVKLWHRVGCKSAVISQECVGQE